MTARIGQTWKEIVPPGEWDRVRTLVDEYERLAAEIDRRYGKGRLKNIEELEERAEDLLETLHGLWYHYIEGEPATGEGVSVEEQLAWAWNNPQAFSTREDWIDNMRDAVVTAGFEEGKTLSPTDEELLAAAKDAAERRARIVRKYRKGRGPSIGADAESEREKRLFAHPVMRDLIQRMTELERKGASEEDLERFFGEQLASATKKYVGDPEVAMLSEERERLLLELETLEGRERREQEKKIEEIIWRLAERLMQLMGGGGRIRRWTVVVETPGDPAESSVHMRERDAEAHVRRALKGIIQRVEFQLDVWKDHFLRLGLGAYHEATAAAVETVEDLLYQGDVWKAMRIWQEFQEIDESAPDGGQVGPPPLWPLVGRISVTVD